VQSAAGAMATPSNDKPGLWIYLGLPVALIKVFETIPLLPKMEIPDAFDRSNRFSVPTYQRGAFDHAIRAMSSAFLGFPNHRRGIRIHYCPAKEKAAKATAVSCGKEKAKNAVSRDLSGPRPAAASITDLTHLEGSTGEEEVGLPPSTAFPRLIGPHYYEENSWEDLRLRCSSHGGRKLKNQAVAATLK
jgi:hypothetical protein